MLTLFQSSSTPIEWASWRHLDHLSIELTILVPNLLSTQWTWTYVIVRWFLRAVVIFSVSELHLLFVRGLHEFSPKYGVGMERDIWYCDD